MSVVVRCRRSRRELIVVAMALLLVAGPVQVAAAGVARIHAIYGDCRITGRAVPSATLEIVWRSREGDLKRRQSVLVRSDGTWSTRCDPFEDVERGDTVRATRSGASRLFTVRRVTAIIDRVDDSVSGRGPMASTIHVRVWESPFVFNDPIRPQGASHVVNALSGPGGRYRADVSSKADLIGLDLVRVRWISRSGDRVDRIASVPAVMVGRLDPWVRVWAAPGTDVTVELRDGSERRSMVAGTTIAAFLDGYLRGAFMDADGDPVLPHLGDTVRAPAVGSDAEFRISAITVAADPLTDRVSGTCLPHSGYAVEIWRPMVAGADLVGYIRGVARADGGFSRDVGAQMDLHRGDVLSVSCRLPTGDVVFRKQVVP
jgi:hypothetical protein